MTQQIVLSDAGEIATPPLHDARLNGLLLVSDSRLLLPIETTDGARLSLALQGVERLRADDFRQGNIILDVTVSTGAEIEPDDVAYAYGLESTDGTFLLQTMERLTRERRLVVRVNSSYGCTLVCICARIEIEDDFLGIGRT